MQKLNLNPLPLFLLVSIFCVPSWSREKIDRTTVQGKPKCKMENLVQYANPFCGTAKNGNEYPGATMPFGMVQWSPDTGPQRRMGGYNYSDSLIYGFSLDHLSGAGCFYAGDFSFTPILGTERITPPIGRTPWRMWNNSRSGSTGGAAPPVGQAVFAEPFSHANENAEPGYYSVRLNNGIKVELTATVRTGFGRFIFPLNASPTIVINAGSNVNGTSEASVQIDPSTRSISGAATGGHFCSKQYDARTIYFYAVFNRAFAVYGTWGDSTLLRNQTNSEGMTAGAYVGFDPSGGRTVLAKIGISYVSVANAKANLEAENPISRFSSRDFDAAVQTASRIWNSWLNRIQVSGGTKANMRTFYSMMYHTLLGPTICSDVNGEYVGSDGKAHVMKNGHLMYTDFSGWDIYRSEVQFLAMIAPRHASDMAQSLLLDYQQGGTFPRWPVPNMDSGVMMGDPAAPTIAGIYAFGARSFDVKDALKGLVRAATDTSVMAPLSHTYERDALGDYLKLGYVPEHQIGGYGNVSMTLEYASADFALSRLAESLGDEADAGLLLRHAQNWKNLYNPETDYIQMRRRDGSWAPGLVLDSTAYDHDLAFVEGTAPQYVWMVPFNLKGLAEKMGGEKTAIVRLDSFFMVLNGGVKSKPYFSKYAYLGNEVCLETPWIYDFWSRPYKTQEIVRRAIRELYSYKPVGYPGNDDLGEMSSWYIFGALGMYPELPGSDILVLGSPLFPKAVLHLAHGKVTIIGHGAADSAPYVHGLTVDGRKWNKPWIIFTDISKGETLKYDLSPTPDRKWGSAPGDAPPSYQ